MRKLLLLPALALLIGAYFFWVWAGQPFPVVRDAPERENLAREMRLQKPDRPIPPELEARARRFGADPEKGYRALQTRGERIAHSRGPRVWIEALVDIPLQEAAEKRQRMELYRQWRIPIGIAAIAVAMLLCALAFSKPKPKGTDTTPSVGNSTAEQA